jgi:hypothetical protein
LIFFIFIQVIKCLKIKIVIVSVNLTMLIILCNTIVADHFSKRMMRKWFRPYINRFSFRIPLNQTNH